MNYTAKKYDCKALLGVALLNFSAFLFTVRAYADDYDVVRIPNFWLDIFGENDNLLYKNLAGVEKDENKNG